MFDKKKDQKNDMLNEKNDVFRPSKGSSKVIIGEGVTIKGEITNAEEVQIDGMADIVLKTENINVGDKTTEIPIGVSCRTCDRLDCSQRAFPPLHKKFDVDINSRGVSVYVNDKSS